MRLLRGAVLAVMVALAALEAGCESRDDAAPAAGSAPSSAPKAAPTGPDPTAQMVNAVSASKAGPPVNLKFELLTHPQVGERADLRIAVIPVSPQIERLSAMFFAAEGLKVVAGSELAAVTRPQAGTPISHTVAIVPSRDGIFHVTAVVTVDEPGSALSRTFAIPVIAGAGIQELASTTQAETQATTNRHPESPSPVP